MLEPIDYQKIFTYFEEISSVPRGSYHNEKISDYLVNFAKEHGLEYRVDEALNVVIKKPASPDCTRNEPVMLQGHMDMVCVSEDQTHDFQKQGLKLLIRDDYLEAEGTTLGGDDGIALAYMLAVLSRDEITHPPIEAVFTTDEEVGMDGASALDVSNLRAKRLINIDNEEEGVLLVSCAGGATARVTFQQEKTISSGEVITFSVSGLTGGHSGTEIAKHPLNASILLGRILAQAYEDHPFRILSFTGGDKDNVITREAVCRIICDTDAAALVQSLQKHAGICGEEVRSAEPRIQFGVQREDISQIECFDSGFTEAVLRFLNLTITGVQVMSGDVPGMVESSLNMGIAATGEDEIRFGFSVRSQKGSYRDHMLEQLRQLGDCVSQGKAVFGFEVFGRYPAWDYKRDSLLRDIMIEESRKVLGREPRVEGIHAGLECGILSHKIPGLDIVSMGPDILDIHTVKERMSISSARRNFDLLLRVLERLAR